MALRRVPSSGVSRAETGFERERSARKQCAHPSASDITSDRIDKRPIGEKVEKAILHQWSGVLDLIYIEGAAGGHFDLAVLAVDRADVGPGTPGGTAEEPFLEQFAAVEPAARHDKRPLRAVGIDMNQPSAAASPLLRLCADQQEQAWGCGQLKPGSGRPGGTGERAGRS